jgi:hypothetical protein
MALRQSFAFTRRKKEEKAQPKPSKAPEPQADPELDLAMKMIEKEHELEKAPEAKTIHELIAIYSEAIEFYSHKNNSKYIDLQKRMHGILRRPEIMQALKVETSKRTFQASSPVPAMRKLDSSPLLNSRASETRLSKSFEEEIQESKENQETSVEKSEDVEKNTEIQKFDEENIVVDVEGKQEDCRENAEDESRKTRYFHKRHLTDPDRLKLAERLTKKLESGGKNLGIIIERHSKTNKTTVNRAAADFKSQDSALERRLASRQKQKLTQSMSFSSCNLNESSEAFKCDISEVLEFNESSTKTSCFVVEEQLDECERFEKMLEEIMEQNYSQRAAKIADIKVKYEAQITEMSGMGDFMKAVVDQMKKNMKEEIDSVVLEFDERKKEQIAALKSSYV